MDSILCIDDDPILLKLMTEYLSRSGYAVHCASNGAAGIRQFESEPADLIVTDLRMPIMSGFEVLEYFIASQPETPVIVLSGLQTVQDAVEAMKCGAWDYFVKPVESFALLELAIRKALERSRLLRENKRYREHLEEEVGKRTAELQKEIQEREKFEIALRGSLNEKDSLLKEIHHRVKNNLQIISSLLSLQISRIEDEHYRNVFIQSQNRIKSMAIVHEELYRSDNLSNINFESYVKTLVSYLSGVYDFSGRQVTFTVDADDIRLPISTAIPCGLILNELVTNAYKHAFGGRERGSILVLIKLLTEENLKDRIMISVHDNGNGLPEDIDMSGKSSLGMQLVSTLVSQLHGNLTVNSEKGTMFTVTFPAEESPRNAETEEAMRKTAGIGF